ncbi:hypothetical protein IU452_08765 [Nocardia transvalensis]|nr:hypothetical protein [Nocardia transvalensis]
MGALAVCLAWAPFVDLDQLSVLATVALVVLCYTAFRLAVAFGVLRVRTVRPGTAECKRVRQQYRLLSRSWLELTDGGRTRWLPVYFDSILVTLVESTAESGRGTVHLGGHRLYPAGPLRDSEPIGRLVDNPTRPDPDGPAHAAHASRLRRRLLLDAQYAVAAPFVALFWVYVVGGGLPAFLCAITVAAVVAIWFAAIRGSDPS